MAERTAPRAAHPLPIDAVLFDLDGTLADTAPDLAAALNRVRADRGLAPIALSTLRPLASYGARGMLGAGLGVTPGHPEFELLRDSFLRHYASHLCVATRLFATMSEVLAGIEARELAWGVVTNKAARFTLPLLAALGVADRARSIVSGDTTPHLKPHPAPLVAAAMCLGLPPSRCVYVGDAERDVIAGAAAGMRTIAARYGYIEAHEKPDEWPADGIIETPLELLAWLPERRGS